MSLRKVFVLVEGQTEESFIKRVLSQFMPEELYLQPVVVATKRVNSGGKFKGGVPSYERVRDEIRRLLADSSARMVTTMLDYYGLPDTFPGRAKPNGRTSEERVTFVEDTWTAAIGDRRFRAYLSLHEFESLLFSDPRAIAHGFGKPEMEPRLAAIRDSFSTPEEINDCPDTAPSARLLALNPGYSKPIYGTLIAEEIGLDTMLSKCPHFARWVEFLRAL